MNNINTKPPKGFKELLPAEQMVFNSMLNTIRETYELHGFIPLDTPVLERAEVLLSKAGGETEKQIYEFTKGKTHYAMRFDHTVPLARYVAEHERELAFPFRRYAIGKVYRGERPQAGRLREFYQCDIDIIGKNELPLSADATLPPIIADIFSSILPNQSITIHVNNRKILNGFYEALGINGVAVMRIVDKLDKIGKDGVSQELADAGISSTNRAHILNFISISGSNTEILSQLDTLSQTLGNAQFSTGVSEIKELLNITPLPENILKINLSIARGLDYYTGTVYETTINNHEDIGSVCSGGRYDNLASAYTSTELPGVGISIGLSRLFDQLRARELVTLGASTPTKILLIDMSTKKSIDRGLLRNYILKFRENKIAVEASPLPLKKAMKYADKLGIPYVVIIGDDEVAQNKYTLKDMHTGEQKTLDKEQLMVYIS